MFVTPLLSLLVPMNLFDPSTLLRDWGPWALAGVALMVFIESGLLFPFLPGDSLLFVAGLMHVSMNISLPVLIGLAAVAAIAGDTVGYWLGEKLGRRMFKPDARILKTSHLDRAEEFFARFGGRSIILARFVPIVRTYIPVAVGSTKYPYRRFLSFNVVGGIGWTGLMIIGGSLLGHVQFIATHIDLICVGIVAVSMVPVALQVVTSMRQARVDAA